MSDNMKIVAWSMGGILAVFLVLVVASNIGLVIARRHDGGLHLFTVFELLESPERRSQSGAKIGLLLGIGACALAAIGAARLNAPALHGRARFANERDLRKGELRASKGILVGKTRGRYLIFGGKEHVIVYAPTRTGKGVGIVIPNLLNWPDSTIVLDVKKENWTITAGFRKACGHEVFLFDPFDPEGRTCRYNPLAYVDRSNEVDLYDGLQRIATMLFPIEGRMVDPFWTESARTAFVGIAGYIAETPELPFTIGEVLRQFAAAPDIKKHFLKIMEERTTGKRALSTGCRVALTDFLAASENTLQSCRKSVTAKLGLWLNRRVDAATSENDFDLRDLRRKPIDVYLGVTPDNLARMAPLLNLFFQQVVDLTMRTLPEHDKSLTRQVLLVMDEFRSLGNVEVLSSGVAFVAGYGLRYLTVIQSPSQLREVYGLDAARNYMTNHAVEVVFTPKELETANELSERFGFNTVDGKSRSRGTGLSKSNRSETTSDQRRALMLPQELTLTPLDKQYVLRSGIPAVRADKIFYFKDKVFKARLLTPPEVPVRHLVSPSEERISALERQIELLSAAVANATREPTLEEITAPVQPADGEDGLTWTLPHDLANAFKDVVLPQDEKAKGDVVDETVSNWLEKVKMLAPEHEIA